MNKFEIVAPIIFGSPVIDPKVSVIIVTYNIGNRLVECLDALSKQDDHNFETILINNGEINIDIVNKYNLYYIDLGKNYGPSYARNVGASVAKAPILAFLDDDAIPEIKWVSAIRHSLESKDVVGVRGRILSNRNNLFNLLAGHYNLGNSNIKSVIDLEGNCGFKRKEYLAVGGFDSKIFGGEGINLTYRLSKFTSASTRYDPSIIIAHDYADSFWHYINKSFRHGKNQKKQGIVQKDFLRFINKYDTKNNAEKQSIKLRIMLLPLYMIGTIAFNLGVCLALIEK